MKPHLISTLMSFSFFHSKPFYFHRYSHVHGQSISFCYFHFVLSFFDKNGARKTLCHVKARRVKEVVEKENFILEFLRTLHESSSIFLLFFLSKL